MSFAKKLHDTDIRNIARKASPYKVFDGGGLYLWVPSKGKTIWRYKFHFLGAEKTFSIGPYPEIRLSEARELHEKARSLVALGRNPVDERKAALAKATQDKARATTAGFETIARHWLDTTEGSLRPSTRKQRDRELNRYVFPVFGGRAVETITRTEVFGFLKGIHATEVARNVRAHLSNIFEFAIDAGLIQANPVPGRKIFGKRSQESHKALDISRYKAFIRAAKNSASNRPTIIAIQLIILTLLRKCEVVESLWAEFRLDIPEWKIPKDRMKKDRDHWVPLSRQALALLRELEQHAHSKHVFPNLRDPQRPMAGGTLNRLIKQIGYQGEATVHGFRSMASTYLNETKKYDPDVIERALAHGDEDKMRGRYNKAEYRELRAKMLQDWADHLDSLERKPTPRRRPMPAPILANAVQNS